MTTEPVAAALGDQRLSENVNTMMFRERYSARRLAPLVGMSGATLSRKLVSGGWTVTEAMRLARQFGLDLSELVGELPTLEELRACRDSNPKPSDP